MLTRIGRKIFNNIQLVLTKYPSCQWQASLCLSPTAGGVFWLGKGSIFSEKIFHSNEVFRVKILISRSNPSLITVLLA
jgi:hypothetical protein